MSADPITVAFDATACLGRTTGVGTFATESLRRLATRPDLSVYAYALSWRGRDQLADAVPPGVGLRTRPAAARPLRALWSRWNFPHAETFTGRVDVVHGSNYVVPPTRRAAALVSVFDLTPIHYPAMCTRDTLAYPGLIARAVRRGAWIHTCSHFVADEIREFFDVDPDRVVVVPAGAGLVHPAEPFARVGDAVSRLDRSDDEFLLALGTVEPRKDLPALVAAFDRLAADRPTLRLVVAGPDGWGTADYDAAVAAADHADRIDRVGWVGEAELPVLLSNASVLVYPSRYEGFGLPPLEAMAAGVPVVTTDAGSLPEVVGDAAAVVSARALAEDRPAGIAALAGAIAEVLDENTDARAERIRRGAQRAASFDWETTAAGLDALYHRMVGS